MIITRTPLRVSFVGGGSDLPSFFQEEPGMVVSAAIDKYVTVVVNRKFDPAIRVAYQETENVQSVGDIRHDRVRAALRRYGPASHLEIHSIADIPGGTGLGSSSSFTVGLLAALHAHAGIYVSPRDLASQAAQIEIADCGDPVGLQDQAIASLGGIQRLTFTPDGVEAEPLGLQREIVQELNVSTLLLSTGMPGRDAAGILREQSRMGGSTRDCTGGLVQLTREFADRLRQGSMADCGEILAAAWSLKRRLSSGIATGAIGDWIDRGVRAGAWGGKLCGAGGGGFLLFLAPPEVHDGIVKATGLRRVPIRLGVPGVTVIYAT